MNKTAYIVENIDTDIPSLLILPSLSLPCESSTASFNVSGLMDCLLIITDTVTSDNISKNPVFSLVSSYLLFVQIICFMFSRLKHSLFNNP